MENEYDKWKVDYLPTPDDDDEMVAIKDAVDSLNSIQKKIWLTYTELGSYAAVGRTFKVSTPTARKYLIEIRNNILKKLNKK